MEIRYALRSLRKSPGFTVTAIATLALGIGVNTGIFSVVNAVLLKPFAYPDAHGIVLFQLITAKGPIGAVSVPEYNLWRTQTTVFQDIAAYDYGGPGLNLAGGDSPEQVRDMHVTANYFRLFGAPVAEGRSFTGDEERGKGAHVVVLSHGLWQRRFGGIPRIVGKSITLGNATYTVIGITGRGFVSDPRADLWLPFQVDPASNDHAHYFGAAARLKPGVTLAMANAQLQVAAAGFRRQYPGILAPPGGFRSGFVVLPLDEAIVYEVRSSLLVLAAAVSFVLLIACANVANLLLVRAAGRRREIAIRAALGASRARIIRQLVTESLLLAAAGGALGLVLGIAGVRLLLRLNPVDIPRIGDHGAAVTLDWRVAAFTVFASVVTGLLFGVFPALGVSRSGVVAALKESGGRSGSGRRQNKTRSMLVVSETALAVVLLISAALLIRSFIALRSVNPGFDGSNVLTLRMSLAGTRLNNTAAVARLAHDAIQRISALPGVIAAGFATSLPLEGGSGLPFDFVARPLETGPQRVGWRCVSPEFFDVFRIPLIRGRGFTEGDNAGSAPVVIINQAMARQFWPNGDALGDRILIGKGYGPEFGDAPRQIAGIVGDVRDDGLEHAPEPAVYVPLPQAPDGITALLSRLSSMAAIVRTRVPPHSLREAIAAELRRASGGLPVANVRTMEEIRSQSTARASFNMTLLTAFGGSALLLAAIGIYGLVAYSVQQRTQELGIRMALGAELAQVRNMIVGHGMRLAIIGVASGVAASFGLTRLLAEFLFGVNIRDPMVFAIVPVVLAAAALIAVWVPAIRVSRIDPSIALRNE